MGDLIFVEGMSGTGKSTTAQFLARQLRHHGRAARWIYEEEVPNPFVPEASNALLPVSSAVFDLEAWPFRISFDERRLTWDGPRLWWGGPTGTYERVLDAPPDQRVAT